MGNQRQLDRVCVTVSMDSAEKTREEESRGEDIEKGNSERDRD